ncbi:hypothetical protein IAT38_006038 [Cryptococcus sp. DSM 104549]
MACLHHPIALLPPARSSSYPSSSQPYCPPPPLASSPITTLPSEVLISIFSFLPLHDLLTLRLVSLRLGELAMSPGLHHTLHLRGPPWARRVGGGEDGPEGVPRLFREVLLPSVRHLWVHLLPASPYPLAYHPFTTLAGLTSPHSPLLLRPRPRISTTAFTTPQAYPTEKFLALLAHIPPNQLETFGLPSSARSIPGEDIVAVVRAAGSRLQNLYLGMSSLRGEGALCLRGLQQLRILDLSGTAIEELPLPTDPHPAPWPQLRELSLASCTALGRDSLEDFLASLPGMVEKLDLSRVGELTKEALMEMRVVWWGVDGEGEKRPTALRAVNVSGVEHLTRRDIREIKAHWEAQRRACFSVSPEPVSWGWQARDGGVTPATPPTPVSVLSPFGTPSPEQLSPLSSSPASFSSGSHWHRPGTLPTPAPSLSPPGSISLPLPSPDTFHPDISIHITHTARLESDDEDGYRQFIGEVAGGTVVSSVPLGGSGAWKKASERWEGRGEGEGECWGGEEMGMRWWRSGGLFEVI